MAGMTLAAVVHLWEVGVTSQMHGSDGRLSEAAVGVESSGLLAFQGSRGSSCRGRSMVASGEPLFLEVKLVPLVLSGLEKGPSSLCV